MGKIEGDSMDTVGVISFFSGCGGLDLGLEGNFWVKSKSVANRDWISKTNGDFVKLKPTPFKTVFACDIKPYVL